MGRPVQPIMLKLRHLWRAIKYRCYSPKSSSYDRYGAVGVTVCDEWLNSFYAFAKWAIESGYKPGLTIDRRSGSKVYSPSTCRWATCREQAQNRKKRVGSKCQYIGVSPHKKRWLSRIRNQGKETSLGSFLTPEEAARAYDVAALEIYGPEAKTNFPAEAVA